MALTPGTRLGPYEIQSAIGAGGMGEVYKASDTRLDRTVAIKILPAALASDEQFRERFDREARAISRLDHSHICMLYDVGEQDGTSFLVMQYLEGETLADRLTRGALPLAEALQFAIHVADALDKAHRAGIVHRDLKPGNIMLTKGGATLLDFGLAKSDRPLVAGAGLSMLPTTPPNLTALGAILGTFQYMAPEQLEGHDADARTDIFAFGAVVYEMLTGQKAFAGKSQASLISSIMSSDPPSISTLQPLTPPVLDRIVRKCLAKDPQRRWQSASDLADELTWVAGAGPSAGAPAPGVGLNRRPGVKTLSYGWVAAVVLLVTTVGLAAALYLRLTPPVDTRVYRSTILPPANLSGAIPGTRFALSPDGRRLALVAPDANGRVQIWVRSLDGLAAQPLAGTEGGTAPFWSPDSRFIAFVAGDKLKKIDASGGPALTLCDAQIGSGTWNRDDVILFTPSISNPALFRVSAAGGMPAPVTMVDAKAGEFGHFAPSFLPDDRHFLYTVLNAGFSPTGIFIGSLDSPARTRLVEGSAGGQYAQASLLFARGSTLMAQPFDPTRLTLAGDAVPVTEQLQAFSVSDSGVLVYQAAASTASQLVWFDRAGGKQIGVLGDRADYADVELSPDGKRAAVSIVDRARRSSDVWLYDIQRGLRTRVTFDPTDEAEPLWSPDGSRLVFMSRQKDHWDFHQKASSGVGNEEALLEDNFVKFSNSWSPDGRFVLYGTVRGPGTDLWVLPLFGDRKPLPFLQMPYNEAYGQFSPDGRWVAYLSNESGRGEVYVAPFPRPAGKWQVSTTGGVAPRWRRDGKEIFYVAPDNKLMAAAVNGQASAFEVGAVQPLFEIRRNGPVIDGYLGYNYDVAADGQRFLVNTVGEEASAAPLTLVVNWQAGIRK